MDRLQKLADEMSVQHAVGQFSTTGTVVRSLTDRYERTFGGSMNLSSLNRRSLGDLPLLFDAAALVSETEPGSAALSAFSR